MQKKLLTLAVAGALAGPGLALAQSSVEVYGTVYPTFGLAKYGEGFSARNTSATAIPVPSMSKVDVQAPSSNFGVRGREGLGGGLTAWFQIEQNAPLEREATQAVTVASRNSAAGIQGGFGNVFVGQWTTPWADMDSLWAVGQVSVFGPVTSLIGRRETTGTAPNPAVGATPSLACTTNNIPPGGSPAPSANTSPQCDAVVGGGGVGHPFWRRASDMIRYTSPAFGGAQLDFMWQIPELKTVGYSNAAGVAQAVNATPQMWSTTVKWTGMGGRARVGVALDRHKDFTTIGETDNGWAVKGGFNFGVADVGVAYESMGYKCGVQPFTVAAGVNNAATMATLCGSSGTIRAKQYAIGVSVPVGLGAIKASYAKAKDLDGPVITGETGAKQWLFGYEHRFSKRTSLGIEYAKIDNNRNAQFTWTGMPPNQNAQGASNTPFFGSDVTWTFVSMTHRF
jgi:predicted porin